MQGFVRPLSTPPEQIAADAALTADRTETKYLVEPSAAGAIAAWVGRELPAHSFRGPRATIAPGRIEYATTIYFDTHARDLYREALASEVHLKLRAREYYSVQPSLTELVTNARDLVRFTPLLWLEIKHKDGFRTQKRRFALPKPEVGAFFEAIARGSATDTLRPKGAADTACVLSEVADLCRKYPAPLRPDCIVNYRRAAWQDEAGTLRVTLDRAVGFFAVPDDLFAREFALVRETLGPPAGTLGAAVLEIKAHAELPDWLARLLREQRLTPRRFSKFVAASRAVHP